MGRWSSVVGADEARGRSQRGARKVAGREGTGRRDGAIARCEENERSGGGLGGSRGACYSCLWGEPGRLGKLDLSFSIGPGSEAFFV
jgi:hypothetical protein